MTHSRGWGGPHLPIVPYKSLPPAPQTVSSAPQSPHRAPSLLHGATENLHRSLQSLFRAPQIHIKPHRDITPPFLGPVWRGRGAPGRRGPLGSIMRRRLDREGWGDRWTGEGRVRGEAGRGRQESEGQWDAENMQRPGGRGGGRRTMGDGGHRAGGPKGGGVMNRKSRAMEGHGAECQ